MEKSVEERFLAELRHHMAGWKTKVLKDFGEESFRAERSSLAQDPVYSKFHLCSPEYVLIRLMGRMSISIGRRLGEMYEKLPRFVAQARYGLTKDQVAPKMDGKLELDICIPFFVLSDGDVVSVKLFTKKHLGIEVQELGLGIEIRYNFNPNDSSRLRKDEEMAKLLRARKFLPIYLIFAENSPRNDAIARLKRAGWIFLVGRPGIEFISELVGTDIQGLLDNPKVAAEIKKEIDELMAQIFGSFAFRAATER